jgi:hypothetical protein
LTTLLNSKISTTSETAAPRAFSSNTSPLYVQFSDHHGGFQRRDVKDKKRVCKRCKFIAGADLDRPGGNSQENTLQNHQAIFFPSTLATFFAEVFILISLQSRHFFCSHLDRREDGNNNKGLPVYGSEEQK